MTATLTVQCPDLPYLVTISDEGSHRPGDIIVDTEAAEHVDDYLLRLLRREEEIDEDQVSRTVGARTATASISVAQAALENLKGILAEDVDKLVSQVRYERSGGCPGCNPGAAVTVDTALHVGARPVSIAVIMPPPQHPLPPPAVSILATAFTGLLRRDNTTTKPRFYQAGTDRFFLRNWAYKLIDMGLIADGTTTDGITSMVATTEGTTEHLSRRALARRLRQAIR